MKIRAILLTLVVGVMPGWAGLEVSRFQTTHNLAPADERIFGRDRATYFRTPRRALPADQQSESFQIRWTALPVAVVKLEYRQLHSAAVRRIVQPVSPGARAAEIVLRGADWQQHGPVTAWCVTLWDAHGSQIAERRSALW